MENKDYKKILRKVGITGIALIAFSFFFFAGAAQAAGGSGIYTSPVKNYGAQVNFGNITWTASTTVNTFVAMKVRAGNVATPDGTWTSWTSAGTSTNNTQASPYDLSAFNGKQYFQYQAALSSIDDNDSPTLHDVNVEYIIAQSGILTSSAYNTSDTANTFGNISWTSASTSATEVVKFQIRTASTSDGLAGLPWCGPTNCSGSDYYTISTGQSTTNATTTDSANDQWMQYKVTLESAGIVSPVLKKVTLQYVVNAPPEFDSSYNGNGILVYQVATSSDPNWGRVNLGYSVRDSDTASGTTPYIVAMTFEYSTSSGATWATIPSGDFVTAIATSSVATSTWSAYTAFWNVSFTLPNTYSTITQVRVTINDGEAANATAIATSTIAVLNTTKPSVATSSLKINGSSGTVNATSSTVTLTLQNITGDSSSETVYVQFATGTSPTVWYGANSGGGAVSTSTPNGYGSGMTIAQATNTSWIWTLGSRTEKISVQVRDAYNNIALVTASSTASWNNQPQIQSVSALQIATTTDSNWGKAQIDFSIRDTDTDLGVNTPNYVSPSFEYNTGSGWNAIASSSLIYAAAPPSGGYSSYGSATTTKVLTASYLAYTAYWTPPAELYSASAQIRLTINDNEVIFNTASSTTSGFLLSSTNPVVSSNSLKINGSSGTVNATSSTVTLTLQNITGDSSSETVYVQFATGTSPTVWYGADSGGGAISTSAPNGYGSGMMIAIATSTNTSWIWTLGSRTEKISVQVRDAYNNIALVTASSTASWNNQPEFQNTITSNQITNNADADWGKVKVDYIARDRDTAQNTNPAMAGYVNISLQYSIGTPWTTWTNISRTYLTGNIGSLVDTNTGKISISASYPGASSTAYWNAVGQLGNYTGSAQVRATIDDIEAIFNTASSTSATISNLDAERPLFSSFTAGTATTNNIQFTDADGDGVADNRNTTLRLKNLTESSSSTQGVYVLFSNDGTNYGTSTNSNGAVSAVATSSISNWEYISGGALVSYSKVNWYLSSTGSRSKTVYVLVKDAYGNEIASAASASVTWNKRPQFSASTISDADNSSILSASSTSGVMMRQCDIYDTDSNCSSGKVKLIYSVRDPDANESGLATKGQLSTTFTYSTDGGNNYNPFIISGAATTTVSLVNADVTGNYNPGYSTTTLYWDAAGALSSGNVLVRVTANDNEAGANTASSTSNTIAYDKTNPSGNNVYFDAGIAGQSSSASVTIPWWNDTNTATNTIQYVIADTSTNSSPANTGWTSAQKNATTTLSWTFDSDIEVKSLDFRFRDIYGNTVATTTVSTTVPPAGDSFLVQDVSKVSTNDWKLYISWQTSTSSSFASYKLEYATSTDNTTFGPYVSVVSPVITDSATNYYVHANLNNALYYRYRVGVSDTNGNTTVRFNAYINTRPDGIQNFGEGGGGSVATASKVENVVLSQASDKTVSASYVLTDSSLSTKTNPSYEATLFYNIGVTLPASAYNAGAGTLTISDASKMPTAGYVQINNEVLRYTGKSGNVLNGLTRGTWPTTGRYTRQNTIFFEGTPVWVKATSTTPVSITNNTISSGQSGSVSWNTFYESSLAGASYTNVGIRALVHDNQAADGGPLSSQNDYSEIGTLTTLDLTAPTIQFSATNASGTESNASATTTLILSRTYPYDSSVNFSFSGTATNTSDYNASSSATISAGATSTTVNLSIINDSANEINETIIITLSSPTNASVGASSTYTYTINDNDNATVSFATATSSAAEGVATATISIVLPSASGQNVSVNYSFSGTASSSIDYSTSTAQTATITSGNTSTTIPITIIDDAFNEEDETIIISLSSPTNATLGATTTYIYTIIDNDNSAPQFSTTTLVSVDRVATSSDANFGKAIITYNVRDTDTNVAFNSSNRYKVTPSFEFNLGNSWQSISSSSIILASSTDNIKQDFNQSVALANYQTFTATWTPTSTSAATGIYSSTTQIRIALSDGETKNSTSTATSTLFVLDTKAPTATFTLDSSQDTVNVTVVEDNAFQYRVSNNSNLSSDGFNTTTTIVSGNWNSVSAISTYTATSSWTFATSTYETIYIEAKDAFNNISTSTIVAPYIPSNFTIKDITNLSLVKYQEFLSWDAYTATTSAAFSSYQIYRATSTNGVYALLTSITNANTVNYSDLNLSSSTTYYYKIRIVDSDNDISGYSAIISDQPDAADDTTAPTFSNIVAAPDTNWAKISWNANELSDSAVDYGFASGSYIASSTSATLIASSTAHEITLSNLATSTTYYYRIRSTDVAGNQGASVESSFTTLNGPLITNVTCIDATDNSIKIIWNTDINSDSVINYATSAAAVSSASDVGSGNVGESASSSVSGTTRYQHTVTLSGLAQGTNYYFRVKSTANSIASILNNNNNYYQCKTSYDTKPPVISNIATPLITDTSAVITWTTDEPSTSKVEYGTVSAATNNYTSSTSRDNALTISHVITITGLTKETKYYYRVQSYDMNPDSATAVSDEQNLTTASEKQIIIVYISSGGGGGGILEKDTTAPVISNIQVSDITSFEVTASFDINEDAIGIIEYGLTTDYGLSTAASNYTKRQTIKLSGLRMGADYHFRIKAIDKSGNYAYSGDQAFKTKYFAESIKELITLDRAYQFQEELEKSIESLLPSLLPPFIEEPRVLDITENSAAIKWKTNVAAYSVASYASENDYELNKAKDNPYTTEISNTDVKTTDHELKISGLTSNTKYHFIVKSFSFPKAVGVSQDMVFVTKAAKVKPRIADIDKDAIRIVWTTDEKASSIVEYRNTRTGDTNRLIKDEKVIDHDVRLENLSPDTVYEIKIMGYNEKNNLIEGGELITVKTSKDIIAPIISNLKIDSALVPGRTDRIQTIVSWKTNEPANSVVEYEEGSGKSSDTLANSDGDKQFYSNNHDVIITKLKPGALYRIRVISVDEAGNKTASPIRTIITPRQSESIIDVIVKNFEDTFQFLKKIR